MAHRDGYCDRCHQKLPPKPPAICLYCSKPTDQIPGRGRPASFCCRAHMLAFETAARRYVIAQVRAGNLTPGDLHRYKPVGPRRDTGATSAATRLAKLIHPHQEAS
jgi:hypothetical protein